MTELEHQLYDALRAVDAHVAVLGNFADKDKLIRQVRRGLQSFRNKRREQDTPPVLHFITGRPPGK